MSDSSPEEKAAGAQEAADGRVPRSPTPLERARLVAALVDALDFARMEQLAAFVFDGPAGDVFNPKSLLSEIALRIVEHAEKRDLVPDLQREARKLNQDNPLLQSWYKVSPAQANSPYRGFDPFGERDEAIFYGRDAVVEELVAAVDRQAIVTVVGPSGSGKTSVVFAGLVPSICSGEGWLYRSFHPGDQPFTALAKALVRLLEPAMSLTNQIAERGTLAVGLRSKTIALADILDEIRTAHHPLPRLLLVVDQFEELFSPVVDDATRNAFLDVLLTAFLRSAERPSPAVLLLVMRADYLGLAKAHPVLAEAFNDAQLTLGQMTEAELRQAVMRPAKERDIELPPDLPDLVLRDVAGQPGRLALLQFTVTRLNELLFGGQRAQPTVLLLPQVEAALIKHADDAVEKLGEGATQLRTVFTHLLALGEGGVPARRKASRQEVGEDAWPLVDRLADERLVVTDYDSDRADATVEVTHDALLHNWPLLQNWVAEDADFLRWLGELRNSLKKWQERSGQLEAAEELLKTGELVVAEGWQRARGAQLSPAQNDYIAQSVARREQDERDALAEQKAETARRSRYFQIVLGGLIVALLLLGWGAWNQYQAIEARAKEDSIRLAQLAREQAADQLDLALLLGIESQPKRTEQARDGLLRSLAASPYLDAILTEHGQAVMSTGFSPDGRFLASGSADGSIHVWDLDNANRFDDLPSEDNAPGVRSLAFGTDHLLATGMMDGTIVILQIADVANPPALQELGRFAGHRDTVTSLAFAPDGQTLASGSADGTITQWQIPVDGPWRTPTPEPFDQPSVGLSSVTSLAFAPDGQTLASSGADGRISLWNVATQDRKGDPLGDQTEPIWSIAYSPGDARLLAVGGADGAITLWDPATREPLQRLAGQEEGVTSLAFSWDGATLASGGWDRSIVLWSVTSPAARARAATGTAIARLENELEGGGDRVTSLAFRPVGRELASGSFDGALLLWDLDRPYAFREPFGEAASFRSVALSPDGTTVATIGFFDNDVRLARLDDPLAGQPLVGHTDRPLSIAFSPDGTLLASAGQDDTIRLWDVASGEERARCEGQANDVTSDVTSLAFLSDERLVSGDANGVVAHWSIASAVCQRELPREDRGQGGKITSIAVTSDGKTLASGDDNGLILVSRAQSSDLIRLQQDDRPGVDVTSLAFAPDGVTLVSGGADGTVTLWDLSHDPPSKRRYQTEPKVTSLAVSPVGEMLAVGSDAGTIALWNLNSEQAIVVLPDAEGRPEVRSITSLAFAADGSVLISGSKQGIVLWNLDPAAWVDLACAQARRNLDEDEEWPRFFPSRESYRITCSRYLPG